MSSLLPYHKRRLQEAERAAVAEPVHMPIAPDWAINQLQRVDDEQGAEAMAQLVQERPIAWVGFDTEFGYDLPPVLIKNKPVYQVRAVRPLMLSVAFAESGDVQGPLPLHRLVVDLRRPGTHPALVKLLALPVPFVAHYARAELFCLWQLGLPTPAILWDTWVAEKLAHLGRMNHHYKTNRDADEVQQMHAAKEAKEEQRIQLGLVATCRRHDVPYSMAVDKERLQASFLTHPIDQPFTAEQIAYAAEDAVAAARLYPHQLQAAALGGAVQQLVGVEMPWVATNARMIWEGVKVDRDAAERVRKACLTRQPVLANQLGTLGIANPRSHDQLEAYFQNKDLLKHFRKAGKASFANDVIKPLTHLDPALPPLKELRKVESLLNDRILTRDLVGPDGRMHADHRHLGADSGRQSSRWPNLLGLDRTMRPLVIAEPGFGIGEVDLCQIEVGIAAAVYDDPKLTEMFNTGDVYCAMARSFYRNKLGPDDLGRDDAAFKKHHATRRDVMKTCTLGIIYGLTSHGLAPRLRIPEQEAQQMLDAFLDQFPALRGALADAQCYGIRRGYADSCMGLRRYRGVDASVAATNWELNWMRNHPVQASACTLFKIAGNRLDRLYPRYGARLILAMHDAYVFEAPLDQLGAVAALTDQEMCGAVQARYPQLRPRADINISAPHCWNKDGKSGALDDWVKANARPPVDAAPNTDFS